MAHILLIDGGLQGLSAAFSLKRDMHYVVIFTSKSDEARKTRFVDKSYIVQDRESYFDQVIKIIYNEQIDVVIPMGDKGAEFLSKNQASIESATICKCATQKYRTFILGSDKANLMAFCEEHQFAHPRTRRISIENIDDAIDYVGFPAMIKPNRSVGARGITLIHNKQELCDKLPHIITTYGDCTLQEYINCEGRPYYNVMIYRNGNGDIIGKAIIEIMRYFPIHGGSSSLCRTINEPVLIEECSKVLDALNWVGMADFDILKNEMGEYKIIEINPRVPASLRSADIAGVNFPEIIVNDLLGLPYKKYAYLCNQYLRYFGLDLLWFIKSPNRWRSTPNWFCSIGRNFYFQDIYARDPHTWFGWLINGFHRYLLKRKHLH